MSELWTEWVAKAEGDYRTARREHDATDQPNYDAVCFHAQQCVEKYLKAALIACGEVPPRTHDLPFLQRLLATERPEWNWDLSELRLLSRSAIASRYPGETADQREAETAFDICERFRHAIRTLLPDVSGH